MIGTGIFRTPDTLMQETKSIAASMLFWLAGACIALAGTMVYVEFGLAIPRLHDESIPRNGGEKNYIEYVYSKQSSVVPSRNQDSSLETMQRSQLLATCLYGIPFICLGTMAGNAISFGLTIMVACGIDSPSNGAVRAIAVGVATFACSLHVLSRWWGIVLNNVFGFVKTTMLLMLIIVGIVSFAGALPEKTRPTAEDNFGKYGGFGLAETSSYGYASSFLSVIFAYGGFNQANYVLGNIYRPRRRFKITALATVATISLFYICLNLCYYGVVPYKDQTSEDFSTVTDFFARTLASQHGKQILNAFLSFSSLGNIIIQTFTAARVKQELAKEGILPFSKFFARSRCWRWKFWRSADRHDYESPEATPMGALLLHWGFTMILILGTFSLSPMAAYKTYVGMYSFTIDAVFGFLVGFGLLLLRIFERRTRWSTISDENKWLSILCATVFTIGNLYPICATWVPPGIPVKASSGVSFWTVGTIGLSTLAGGCLWWIGVRFLIPLMIERDLKVERFLTTGNEGGETVVINEIVSISWEDR
ncbi:hypothetical protein LTR67_011100 [Exophiala xenobiotica]